MQQALLKAHIGTSTPSWQYAELAQRHSVTPPVKGEGRKIVFSFLAVALLHAALIALLITRTTEYKPLNLVNPAESISIQVTIAEDAGPEPAPEISPEPPVLTSEQGEREIAPIVKKQEPLPAPTPPVKQEVKKAPLKPAVKPNPVPRQTAAKPRPAAGTEHKTMPAPAMPVAATGSIPNDGKGAMMQNDPGAQPKNVASVGCAVPQPEYPRRARRLQEEGEVLIRLVINPEGRLLKHEIARSSGHEALDQAAMTAIAHTRCTPYRENGQAITVMTLQPVKFKLSR